MRDYIIIGTVAIIGGTALVYLSGASAATVMKAFLGSVALWGVVALIDRWLL